jgi:hypothetical protein
VQATEFDEELFFSAIGRSGARALLIGRRALIALGVPVLTADYDFWIHPDDISAFNGAAVVLELHPDRGIDEARASGRYVLDNDEHVDVLVARAQPTVQGERVAFDDVWARRVQLELAGDARLYIPCVDDLIKTKLFAARARDLDDIQLLRALQREQE